MCSLLTQEGKLLHNLFPVRFPNVLTSNVSYCFLLQQGQSLSTSLGKLRSLFRRATHTFTVTQCFDSTQIFLANPILKMLQLFFNLVFIDHIKCCYLN